MTDVPVWFERKFDFTFPVELHPNIRARLRGTPARLEELLQSRPAKILTNKPRANENEKEKWSPQEHAGHLLDLAPLWLARVEDYVNSAAQLSATDLQNRKTDEANYNSRRVEKILADFRREREKLLRRVSELGNALFSRTIPHP